MGSREVRVREVIGSLVQIPSTFMAKVLLSKASTVSHILLPRYHVWLTKAQCVLSVCTNGLGKTKNNSLYVYANNTYLHLD